MLTSQMVPIPLIWPLIMASFLQACRCTYSINSFDIVHWSLTLCLNTTVLILSFDAMKPVNFSASHPGFTCRFFHWRIKLPHCFIHLSVFIIIYQCLHLLIINHLLLSHFMCPLPKLILKNCVFWGISPKFLSTTSPNIWYADQRFSLPILSLLYIHFSWYILIFWCLIFKSRLITSTGIWVFQCHSTSVHLFSSLLILCCFPPSTSHVSIYLHEGFVFSLHPNYRFHS